jgi:predicted negative regulator of RcsB-dependent stress response
VAKITRKELKTDKFALEVEQTVTFFEEHQQQFLRYGGIALAVILLLVGYMFYSRHQQAQREVALYQAIQIEEAPVGPPVPGATNTNFPTQEAKDQVAIKAFSDILTAYPHSSEGQIAQYYLGSIYADEGKLPEAEKNFKLVADNASDQYSSLAKLSLAQIYFADGRGSQGEALLRGLIEHPTIFVSKEQATIALAHYLAAKNPNEARKLIAPLRSVPGPVGQAAMSLDTELPPQ